MSEQELAISNLNPRIILEVRDSIWKREKQLIMERNFLNKHSHTVEAMVKSSIISELELIRFKLEAPLDKAGIKYYFPEL